MTTPSSVPQSTHATRSPNSPVAVGHRRRPGGRRGEAPGRRTSRLVPASPRPTGWGPLTIGRPSRLPGGSTTRGSHRVASVTSDTRVGLALATRRAVGLPTQPGPFPVANAVASTRPPASREAHARTRRPSGARYRVTHAHTAVGRARLGVLRGPGPATAHGARDRRRATRPPSAPERSDARAGALADRVPVGPRHRRRCRPEIPG